jgi:hypothetical protein
MMTAVILNVALAIPVFAAIIGLVLWSIRTQTADRAHVLPRRTRRPVAARRRLRGSRRTAWPAH